MLWDKGVTVKTTMPTRLKRLLAWASSLSAPTFDTEMEITNWPRNVADEFHQLIKALYRSTNSTELRECADILNKAASPEVPEAVLQMLSRAVFDNPDTPLRET